MELFYAYEVSGRHCRLDAEESGHCVRVLRHRAGDEVDVIDGRGALYHCRLTQDSPKGAEAEILSQQADWGAHPYHLTIGCCPTKNNDRFEWFVEKATELGVDCIVPLIGEHSERKVYKTEPLSVKEFICHSERSEESLRLIAYCFEDETHPRQSIRQVLDASGARDITVLIGPEGDFSPEEASLALAGGYIPVHLGASRLRTETAAVTAVEAVYLHFMQ